MVQLMVLLGNTLAKKDDWQVFYNDYVAIDEEQALIDVILVEYTKSTNTLVFYDESILKSLVIFTDDAGDQYFVRVDYTRISECNYVFHVYLDEIYGKTYASPPFNRTEYSFTFHNVLIESNQSDAKDMTISNIYLKTDELEPIEERFAALEANSISKNSLSKIFIKAMMRCGSGYKSTTNYGELAAEYIEYITLGT